MTKINKSKYDIFNKRKKIKNRSIQIKINETTPFDNNYYYYDKYNYLNNMSILFCTITTDFGIYMINNILKQNTVYFENNKNFNINELLHFYLLFEYFINYLLFYKINNCNIRKINKNIKCFSRTINSSLIIYNIFINTILYYTYFYNINNINNYDIILIVLITLKFIFIVLQSIKF